MLYASSQETANYLAGATLMLLRNESEKIIPWLIVEIVEDESFISEGRKE